MYMALNENVKPKWLFEFYEWSIDEMQMDEGMSKILNCFLNLKKL